MRSFYIALAFVLSHFVSFGQSASYGFTGKISLEERESLEIRAGKIPGILSIKCKYKEDSERGELIIELHEVDKNKRAEEDLPQFSPVDLKRLLLEFNLTPVDFILLNN